MASTPTRCRSRTGRTPTRCSRRSATARSRCCSSPDVTDREAVLRRESLRDERAVARLRVALDAEQGGRAVGRQLLGEGAEVDVVEDLAGVALDVGRRELDARALADAVAVVLGVLEVAQLGRGRELRAVLVGDARVRERRLKPLGVRPGVLRSADAAPLAHV